MRRWLSLALSAGFVARALEDGLARRPPLGWRSWNAYGATIDDTLIRAVVDAVVLVRAGGESLLTLGFGRIGLDDGWQACGTGVDGSFHATNGTPLVNLTRFPDLKNLVRYGHERGVFVDFYQINCVCLDTYKLRANETWAKLAYAAEVRQLRKAQFDGVKLDNCGDDDGSGYVARLAGLATSGRPLLVENSNQGHGSGPPRGLPTDAGWCPFHMFRTGGDIRPNFPGTVANLQRVTPFENISRPGCWAFPDMLEVGNFGYDSTAPTAAQDKKNALALVESRTHFGLWCIASSPLMLSLDLLDAARVDAVWPVVSNKEAVAVNQAWFGSPGRLVSSDDSTQLWAKPLGPGAVAALVFNRRDETLDDPIYVDLTGDLGFNGALGVRGRDVWNHRDIPPVKNSTSATWTVPPLAAHDSAFFIFHEEPQASVFGAAASPSPPRLFVH